MCQNLFLNLLLKSGIKKSFTNVKNSITSDCWIKIGISHEILNLELLLKNRHIDQSIICLTTANKIIQVLVYLYTYSQNKKIPYLRYYI